VGHVARFAVLDSTCVKMLILIATNNNFVNDNILTLSPSCVIDRLKIAHHYYSCRPITNDQRENFYLNCN